MPRPPRRRRGPTGAALLAIAGIALVGGATAGWALTEHRTSGPVAASASVAATTVTSSATPLPTVTSTTPTPTVTPTPTFDLAAHSTTDPASPWVVVNKQHPLDPLEYAPADLVAYRGIEVSAAVQPDLDAMVQAAAAEGVGLGMRSGYRSYSAQLTVHANLAAKRGEEHAEKYSARAGYSEHQTGFALDVASTSNPACTLQTCFGDTVEGVWLAQHAGEYGFVIRYTDANTEVTGYSPEAWHLRWVGRDLTAYMAAQGLDSLEATFGVTGGSTYATG